MPGQAFLPWWTQSPGILSGMGWACFRVPSVICCCHTPSRRRNMFCQIHLLQLLLVLLWRSSHSFFQSRDKAPMAGAPGYSGQAGRGSDGWQMGTANNWEGGWDGAVSAHSGWGWQGLAQCGYQARKLLEWEMCFSTHPSIPPLPHTAFSYTHRAAFYSPFSFSKLSLRCPWLPIRLLTAPLRGWGLSCPGLHSLPHRPEPAGTLAISCSLAPLYIGLALT